MKDFNLPQKWDLYKFTGLPRFNDWDEGIQANTIYLQKKKKLTALKKIYGWVSVISTILSPIIILKSLYTLVMITEDGGGMGLLFGILLLLTAVLFQDSGYIKRTNVYDKLDAAASDWYAVLYKHANMFIKPLAAKLMSGGSYCYRTEQKCLIYNKEGCVYFDTYDSTLVAYHKSNIKDITRERLHVGSSTSGGASTAGAAYTFDNGVTIGGASTNTYSNTVNTYEWHLDIFTDFIDYPKVSLVLDDDSSVEDFVGKAYALLKP